MGLRHVPNVLLTHQNSGTLRSVCVCILPVSFPLSQKYFGLKGKESGTIGSEWIVAALVEQLYAERDNIPATFGYTPISKPVWEFAETCHPNDKGLIRMMNRFGISKDIVRLYTLEGSIPHVRNGHRR